METNTKNSGSCHMCAHRVKGEQGLTVVDRKGRCRCSLNIKSACEKNDSCLFFTAANPLSQRDILEIIKSDPITFTEDVLMKRKLTVFERKMVDKFMPKYYTPSSNNN